MFRLSCPDKTKRQCPLFIMSKITQDIQSKQAVIEYSSKHSVTKSRNLLWDQQAEAEIKLIKNMHRRNPHAGVVVFRVKLNRSGLSAIIYFSQK